MGSPIIVARPRPDAERALYVFPHAGGGASYFREWGDALGPDTELRTVQYPGHESRLDEPVAADMGDLVDGIVAAVRSDAPYAFFGHSMGAFVALETARALHRRGSGPAHLFISAAKAPFLRAPVPGRVWTDAALADSLQGLGGTPRSLIDNPELRAMLLRVLGGDYRLLDEYRFAAGPALPVGITACRGEDDATASEAEVAAWRRLASGRFDHHAFPGGHFYLADALGDLIALIRKTLDDELGR